MNRRIQDLRDWARWEFGRRIEVTTAIRLITLERFLKAVILIGGGIILLILGAKTDLHQLVERVQDQLNLDSGRGWWRQLFENVIDRFGRATRLQTDSVAIGAILYGCLEAFEGFGLLLRRRWAEYLVLIATAAFLALAIGALLRWTRHGTMIRALADNPTGAMGLADYLGWNWRSKAGLPIVNVPGCPVQPDNMMETLLYLL